MSDPLLPAAGGFAPVRIVECGDPLVDVATVDSLLVPDGTTPGAGPFLRGALVERLITAQALLPPEVRFQVVGGYRAGGGSQRCAGRHAVGARIVRTAGGQRPGRGVWRRGETGGRADPHATGAAVDLTLCDPSGNELWLGTKVHATPESCGRACYTASPYVPPEPRARRLLLVRALTTLNLVNDPSAWWHWSYGDRDWALVSGAHVARFGPLRQV